MALAAVLVLSLPLAAGAAMTNGITGPKNGATVSGTVEVKGYASDPGFMKWQLDLLPGGDPNAAIFLALGQQAGEFSYSLNTMGLPNGEHAFRLRVVRADSNYAEYVSKFTIANGAAAPAAPAAAKDIVATAIGAGQFKTLVAAVQAAGLVEALQGRPVHGLRPDRCGICEAAGGHGGRVAEGSEGARQYPPVPCGSR